MSFIMRPARFAPTGVTIANSALFDSANSEDLTRSGMSGTATTWTASLWVQRCLLGDTNARFLFTTAGDAGLAFSNNSTADVLAWYGGSYVATTAVFRDTNGWYHIVVKNSGGTGTVYVNNTAVLSSLTVPSAGATMAIGSYLGSSSYFDGYMAQFAFVDGTAKNPSDFADASDDGNYWTPKSDDDVKVIVDAGGSNSFLLDNASNAETDASSKSNSFTNNNTVLTSSHSPTHINCLLNPLYRTTDPVTLTGGNLIATWGSAGNHNSAKGTISYPSSGKWYFEATYTTDPGGFARVGVSGELTIPESNFVGQLADGYGYVEDGTKILSGSATSYGNSYGAGDIIGIYMDRDNNAVWFSKNGTPQNSATTSEIIAGTTTNAAFTSVTTATLFPTISHANNGAVWSVNFGDSSFNTALLTGYKALNTTTIAKSVTLPTDTVDDHFQAQIVAHDGSSTSFTLNWNPDTYQTLYKIKRRDGSTEKWFWINTKSGITKYKDSTAASAATTDSNVISQSGTTVTLGSTLASASYLVECYRFDTTDSTPSNAGTIATTVSVNTVTNWSLAFYSGTGANGTLGHGLSSAPGHIEWWNMDASTNVVGYWEGMGATKVDLWNDTAPSSTSVGYLNNTAPTATVTSIGSDGRANGSSNAICMLSFGNSQFVKSNLQYEGNANADGAYVPVISSQGILLQPKYIISHNRDATAERPTMNTTTGPTNPNEAALYTGDTAVEVSSLDTDIGNGFFKPRVTNVNINASNTYDAVVIGQPIISGDKTLLAGR